MVLYHATVVVTMIAIANINFIGDKMFKTDTLTRPSTKAETVSDWLDDLQAQGMGIVEKGIERAGGEASNFIDKQAKELLGNTGSNNPQRPQLPMPTKRDYVQMQNQPPSQPTAPKTQSKGSQIVKKAKDLNPVIAGVVSMGIAKLIGMDWVRSAGIGAGVGGAKYFLVDKKQ